MLNVESKKELKALILLLAERFKRLEVGFDDFTDSELRIAVGDTITPLRIIEERLDET